MSLATGDLPSFPATTVHLGAVLGLLAAFIPVAATAYALPVLNGVGSASPEFLDVVPFESARLAAAQSAQAVLLQSQLGLQLRRQVFARMDLRIFRGAQLWDGEIVSHRPSPHCC